MNLPLTTVVKKKKEKKKKIEEYSVDKFAGFNYIFVMICVICLVCTLCNNIFFVYRVTVLPKAEM